MSSGDTKQSEMILIGSKEVFEKIVIIRGTEVISDADVAALYGVLTKEVNQAVRNNLDKFPSDYMFELSNSELHYLRSKILTTKVSIKSRSSTKAFTEKGLYMLATILKSERAKAVTFAIIETFSEVRGMRRKLLELHKETDKKKQLSMMDHFGNMLADIVMPDLQTNETESSLEINFFIGKLKHTVKRVRKEATDQ
jgi:hypothetical protein